MVFLVQHSTQVGKRNLLLRIRTFKCLWSFVARTKEQRHLKFLTTFEDQFLKNLQVKQTINLFLTPNIKIKILLIIQFSMKIYQFRWSGDIFRSKDKIWRDCWKSYWYDGIHKTWHCFVANCQKCNITRSSI